MSGIFFCSSLCDGAKDYEIEIVRPERKERSNNREQLMNKISKNQPSCKISRNVETPIDLYKNISDGSVNSVSFDLSDMENIENNINGRSKANITSNAVNTFINSNIKTGLNSHSNTPITRCSLDNHNISQTITNDKSLSIMNYNLNYNITQQAMRESKLEEKKKMKQLTKNNKLIESPKISPSKSKIKNKENPNVGKEKVKVNKKVSRSIINFNI